VVISARQVLTCRHVIERVRRHSLCPPPSGDQTQADQTGSDVAGRGGWWVICHQHQPSYATIAVARVTFPAPGTMADLALLELVADVPEGITPAPVAWVDAHDLVEDGWWAYGHPDGDPLGNTARGVVGAALGYGYLRLDLDGLDGEQVAAGFSGAGLWSPSRSAVVAVVAQHGPGGGGRAVTLAQAMTHVPGAVFATTTVPGDDTVPPRGPEPTPPQDDPFGLDPEPGTVIGAIPARPSPWVDRLALLGQIRDALNAGTGSRRVVCLVGPGGTGKSQLAGEYARRVAEAGEAVVAWMGAETAAGLRESYADLGRRLGVGVAGEDSAALARKTITHLARATQPVLLVL
jgi:hypothetical protein